MVAYFKKDDGTGYYDVKLQVGDPQFSELCLCFPELRQVAMQHPNADCADEVIRLINGKLNAYSVQEAAAQARIMQLRLEVKKGFEIGAVLLQEGYTLQQARHAFKALGFVVAIETFTSEEDLLHVSDRPLTGLSSFMALSEPRALPYVHWPKKPAADVN